MKRSAIMTIICLMALTSLAKSSSTPFSPQKKTCEEYKSLYYHYLKIKKYQDARHFWLLAYEECGGTNNLNNAFFTNGNIIYKGLAEETFLEDSIHRVEVLDSIPWIYEQHLIVAPSGALKLSYAEFLLNENSQDTSRLNELFETVHSLKGNTPARSLCYYFKHKVLNELSPSSGENRERIKGKLLEDYFLLLTYANDALEKCETIEDENLRKQQIRSYKDAKVYIAKYVVAAMRDCVALTLFLDVQLKEMREHESLNTVIVNEGLTLMDKLKCTSSAIYVKYVQATLELEPTSKGYESLGLMEYASGNYPAATVAFEKAIELEVSDSILNGLNYKRALSLYEEGKYKEAFRIAKEIQGHLRGKAMIICGNVVAVTANNCGDSTFDREANFWLANDYYQKAADLGEQVDRKKFSDRWPDPTTCFSQNKKMGDSILLPCWKEKTVIRK